MNERRTHFRKGWDKRFICGIMLFVRIDKNTANFSRSYHHNIKHVTCKRCLKIHRCEGGSINEKQKIY